MRAHRIILLAGFLLAPAPLVCASRAQSVASPGSQPAAVVDSFFRAEEQERWTDAARLMDLHAVGAMRDQEVSNVRMARLRVHHVTPEELMRFDPKMPRVVAKSQAAKSNEQVGRFDWIRHEYADVPSADSLASLSTVDAAARWLEARDTRYMMRRALGDTTTLADPNVVNALKEQYEGQES